MYYIILYCIVLYCIMLYYVISQIYFGGISLLQSSGSDIISLLGRAQLHL